MSNNAGIDPQWEESIITEDAPEVENGGLPEMIYILEFEMPSTLEFARLEGMIFPDGSPNFVNLAQMSSSLLESSLLEGPDEWRGPSPTAPPISMDGANSVKSMRLRSSASEAVSDESMANKFPDEEHLIGINKRDSRLPPPSELSYSTPSGSSVLMHTDDERISRPWRKIKDKDLVNQDQDDDEITPAPPLWDEDPNYIPPPPRQARPAQGAFNSDPHARNTRTIRQRIASARQTLREVAQEDREWIRGAMVRIGIRSEPDPGENERPPATLPQPAAEESAPEKLSRGARIKARLTPYLSLRGGSGRPGSGFYLGGQSGDDVPSIDLSQDDNPPGDQSQDDAGPEDQSQDNTRQREQSQGSSRPRSQLQDNTRRREQSQGNTRPREQSQDGSRRRSQWHENNRPREPSQESSRRGSQLQDNFRPGEQSQDNSRPRGQSQNNAPQREDRHNSGSTAISSPRPLLSPSRQLRASFHDQSPRAEDRYRRSEISERPPPSELRHSFQESLNQPPRGRPSEYTHPLARVAEFRRWEQNNQLGQPADAAGRGVYTGDPYPRPPSRRRGYRHNDDTRPFDMRHYRGVSSGSLGPNSMHSGRSQGVGYDGNQDERQSELQNASQNVGQAVSKGLNEDQNDDQNTDQNADQNADQIATPNEGQDAGQDATPNEGEHEGMNIHRRVPPHLVVDYLNARAAERAAQQPRRRRDRLSTLSKATNKKVKEKMTKFSTLGMRPKEPEPEPIGGVLEEHFTPSPQATPSAPPTNPPPPPPNPLPVPVVASAHSGAPVPLITEVPNAASESGITVHEQAYSTNSLTRGFNMWPFNRKKTKVSINF
ncbi:hypothetical protein V501_09391 [Pseudogymnoascus sp. VKM F-4519 (FW-2642)]|nr:hypothetical protein V501_09391 [Pseudogymnoascus sp. VKM F-4519 (FW-2642)]